MDNDAAAKSKQVKKGDLFYGVARDRNDLLVHPDFLGPDAEDDLNTIDAYNANLDLGMGSRDFEPEDFREVINSIRTMGSDDVPGVLKLVSEKKYLEERCLRIKETKKTQENELKIARKALSSFLSKNNMTKSTEVYFVVLEKEQLCHHIDEELHTLDTEIKNLESKTDRLKAWFSFLKLNIDYIDIRKIIAERQLNPEGCSTNNKLVKNIPKDKTRSPAKNRKELQTVLSAWSEGNKAHMKFPLLFRAWVHNAFFRKLSKLGILFASKQGLNIHWNVSFEAEANVSLNDAVAEKESADQIRSPISASELRCYLRNKNELSNQNSFWNLPMNYDKKIPDVVLVPKKVIDAAAKRYTDLKTAAKTLKQR